ncbi:MULTISPECIES: signal recognition particle-docking protein FtsY [unclassified Breznakia]|uniref:signal recognition particle-docking protein FtsY n=1 Tax=unclassified Breznakia TaxID=2623764 RepID=UPI002473DC9A|nr:MULTISPECIES: signal recognition particle-docking protein FtsY [unclassified Breznakia]MDH6366745.1 fused signal recognition particle receptor [Breznakia sp. PH1-1]MDH6418579.1 fused signal recognition particle receptor [Breznakia sp. PFB1-12]MDH6473692.1 fused signal recognition particle receptor [Breznakia sp. PFB2-30]MDH6403868.1 fused signal recognition particle receptor [Breznakia sp. PF1-11]MDH6411577.1 fused signal recognition particle receptor [Breznakia sp. PFB1-11]
MGFLDKLRKKFTNEQPDVEDIETDETEPVEDTTTADKEVIEQEVVQTQSEEQQESVVPEIVQSDRSDANRYLSGLSKTKVSFTQKLKNLARGFKGVDSDFLEELMIVLLEADLGIDTAEKLIKQVEKRSDKEKATTMKEVNDILFEEMQTLYNSFEDAPFIENADGPTVILMVGVNGSGKTTTTAKLANMFKEDGKSVMVTAADTFRAGAVDQLKRWADRIGVDCVEGRAQADPASVIVDGARFAKEHNNDIMIADTAGRLQNKVNLMNELKKIHKVIDKEIPGQPAAVWLVIDATTGQNGISQAKEFMGATNVTGVILTKLDGSAKGGIVLAIRNMLGLPVKYVGLGEGVDDLRPFDIDTFLYGIMGDIDA